jgi:hypothetical protein
MVQLKRPIATEHDEQCCFVEWFRTQYPDVRIMAVPNGMRAKGIRTAVKAKKEGMSAGFPDLFIPAWQLFIEMKRTKGGKVSPEQKDWLRYLQECGYTCYVANGAKEAITLVRQFLADRPAQSHSAGKS